MKPPNMLVVDDNSVNLALLTYLLEDAGCRVFSAEHGLQALEMLTQRCDFDAILCDIQMPVMDGYEFARKVNASNEWRAIPLIAISALAMVGDRDRILAAGFAGYVSKPIEPAQFIDTLRELVPTLWAADSLLSPAPVPAPSPLRPASMGVSILALDDTPNNLQLKRDLLEPLGYRVVTADNPADAIRLARIERPQLIISDVGMQPGSGFDFIAMVKADPMLRDIPFIFLSATHWDDSARARGLSLGAARYLRRPIESEALLHEIQRCLDEAGAG